MRAGSLAKKSGLEVEIRAWSGYVWIPQKKTKDGIQNDVLDSNSINIFRVNILCSYSMRYIQASRGKGNGILALKITTNEYFKHFFLAISGTSPTLTPRISSNIRTYYFLLSIPSQYIFLSLFLLLLTNFLEVRGHYTISFFFKFSRDYMRIIIITYGAHDMCRALCKCLIEVISYKQHNDSTGLVLLLHFIDATIRIQKLANGIAKTLKFVSCSRELNPCS